MHKEGDRERSVKKETQKNHWRNREDNGTKVKHKDKEKQGSNNKRIQRKKDREKVV